MPRFQNTSTGVIVHGEVSPSWGGDWERLPDAAAPSPQAAPSPAPEPAAEEAEEPADSGLPSARATVKEWVTFMAEKGIEHPDDATKAEMRVIAEEHFEGGTTDATRRD